MRAVGVVLFATLLSAAVFAQSLAEQQITEVNKQYQAQINAKDYDGAISSINRMLDIADAGHLRVNRSAIVYARACLHALAGRKPRALADLHLAMNEGFNDYWTLATDADLISLKDETEFKLIRAELKRKYGPQILEWDRSQPAPDFKLTFDDRRVAEYLTMRKEFVIDPVVAGGKSDYERLKALTTWTSAQWQHSPTQMAKSTDPLGVLREARAGGRFICTDYAIVLAGAARAYGMKARVLNLMPKDVESRSEAHTLTEVWLPQFEKWVLADGQYGVIAEKAGVPLNALELQKTLAAEEPVTCVGNTERCAEWKWFVLRNLYYFKIADDQRSFGAKKTKQLVLVPKGAPEPHKFAGGNEEIFNGAIYTSNPDPFYARPSND